MQHITNFLVFLVLISGLVNSPIKINSLNPEECHVYSRSPLRSPEKYIHDFLCFSDSYNYLESKNSELEKKLDALMNVVFKIVG